jgi:hypothetical protein
MRFADGPADARLHARREPAAGGGPVARRARVARLDGEHVAVGQPVEDARREQPAAQSETVKPGGAVGAAPRAATRRRAPTAPRGGVVSGAGSCGAGP